MFLMIDNYDSFVYNLVRYIKELDEDVIVVRNDALTLDDIDAMNLEGIIISPGPKRPEDAGISEDIVRKYSGKIPILGICLGHQVIGHVFGGNVIKGKEPVHGKVHPVVHDGEGLFSNIPSPFEVTRYHSLALDEASIPNCLDVTCRTNDGVIMGIRHNVHPTYGVQFHPEAALTQYGHDLIRNFIRISREDRFNADSD